MREGVGGTIRFPLNNHATVQVVGENAKWWLLSNGRVARKATRGVYWVWATTPDDSEDLANVFSRLDVRESLIPFYSFGTWGYYTNDHESQIMPGFTSDPPGAEVCGIYKIVFVAALRYYPSQEKANILLRRLPNCPLSRLVIKERRRFVTVGINGRLGVSTTASTESETMYSGTVEIYGENREVDRFFGPGYNLYSFGATSSARQSYRRMPSNSALIVTKLNDNKGRLYKVDATKAFKLVTDERGVVHDEVSRYSSQQEETEVARRSCKCQHFSFLCKNLGLPCSASVLVTSFVLQHQPYIFAEPGDLWLDIKLTTSNRTYILARPCSKEEVYGDDSDNSDFSYW